MNEKAATPPLRIDIGAIAVTGARPGTGAGLAGHVERAIRDMLGSGELPGASSIDLSRLAVDLPPGAGDREIAEAVAAALRRQLRRAHPERE
jgi:hypothetical protein